MTILTGFRTNRVRPLIPIAFSVFLFSAIGHAADKPNVILVITDDQGYGDLGCHGNTIIQTPNLDRLYEQSVRLTDFHVSPLCTPTRAGLMTGQNPVRVGAWGTTWGRSLPHTDATTMAEVFAASGYRTGCFGKWHLGDNYPFRPQDRGFQEVLVHGGGGVGQAPDFWGNDYFDDTYFRNGKPEKHEGYCTDIWFDAAWDFIKNGDRPFFVYLTTNAPHGPFLVADKYRRLYEKNPDCPHPAFYGMITNIDENMGRLVQRLEADSLTDNTILIFMTDNGTSAGYRGGKGFNAGMRGTKGSLHDGGHRVPCFIHWPSGGLRGGRDVADLASHIDMIPTLAELCGVSIPQTVPLDGISLAPLLLGQIDSLPDREVFVQYRQSSEPPEKGNATVMTERWRLVGNRELFDIDADPGQQQNVASQHPEVVDRLRQAYDCWWTETSTRFDEYSHIILGNDAENPVRLCSFDWHTRTAWSQGQVRSGMPVNSFWAVEVARAGSYEITLRRWPEEADTPINAAVPGGKAISASRARLKIAQLELSQPIPRDAAAVTFSVDLKPGKTTLQTWLIDEETGQSRGAYYVHVRRL
jgi:arylsulfatase A-like enzyme